MKRVWKSSFLKTEFEYGAKFGLGVYQLYLSVLPPKILKILEWVGFRGDRDEGLRLLYEAADSNACRALFAKWFPMFYYYMAQLGCLTIFMFFFKFSCFFQNLHFF